jgi:hypothetical protein
MPIPIAMTLMAISQCSILLALNKDGFMMLSAVLLRRGDHTRPPRLGAGEGVLKFRQAACAAAAQRRMREDRV